MTLRRRHTPRRVPRFHSYQSLEMQEPDVKEHKTPLLEVLLQRPVVIRTVRDC